MVSSFNSSKTQALIQFIFIAEDDVVSMLLVGDSSISERHCQREAGASSGHVRHAHRLPAPSVSRSYSRNANSQFLNQPPVDFDEEHAFASAIKESFSTESPSSSASGGKETQPKSKIIAEEVNDGRVTRREATMSPRRSRWTEELSPKDSKEAKLSETETTLTLLTSLSSYANQISMLSMTPQRMLVSQDAASVNSDLTGLTGCFHESQSAGAPNHRVKPSALKVRLSSLVESTPHNAMATPEKISVSFHKVSVRPYERILTVNPSCSSGPPIGLGWKYGQEKHYLVDTFDEHRTPQRRSKTQLMLPRESREVMLLEVGYDRRALAYGVRQVIKAKNQRRRTVVNLGNAAFEEKVESAKNGVKSIFVSRKR